MCQTSFHNAPIRHYKHKTGALQRFILNFLQILFFHRLLQSKINFLFPSFLCNLMFYTYQMHLNFSLRTASSIFSLWWHKKKIQGLKLLFDPHWKLESFLKAHLWWRVPPRVGDERHTCPSLSLKENLFFLQKYLWTQQAEHLAMTYALW